MNIPSFSFVELKNVENKNLELNFTHEKQNHTSTKYDFTNSSFGNKASNGKARIGKITTAHGEILTPAFMPVGTAATVKAIKNVDLIASGAQIILGNTYHLMLRPGADLIAEMGGLRSFNNWQGPILTDSGGFQVMSLAKIRKINDEGVIFHSHIDGSKHFLSPESSIKIQHQLDSTITMAFDECVGFEATKSEAEVAMNRSLDWAKISREKFVERSGYAIFGIIQGGTDYSLRMKSIESMLKVPFDGYAVGGLAVGEGQKIMFEVLDYVACNLPQEKPRYLMGVGKPRDIVGAVLRGVDMFDCVIPTRSGRTGQAFTKNGEVNIRNSRYRNDPLPLQEDCNCYACKNHSKSYLHHLVKSNEILGSMLLTEHNLFYYQALMQEIRMQIAHSNFNSYALEFLTKSEKNDI